MKKKILTTFTLATFLLVFTVSHAPIQAEDNVVTDYEEFEGENFGNNVFLPLVGRDYEENTVIDFEGLAEGEIVDFPLRYGVGISGVEIEGEIIVEGFNPNFPGNPPDEPTNTAMIFDANCEGGCSGEDFDLDFSRDNLGNVLIISEDLYPDDPDDAESPGEFYFKFDFSKIENAIVNVKKLTYGDIDDYETPGLIEASKDTELKVEPIPLQITGNNGKKVAQVNANDIDSLVVKFYGSMMIDNIEIEIVPTTSFDVTIGYEDRLREDLARIDYDYNDWAVSIFTKFEGDFVDEDTIELEKITFKMMPKARGGKIGHQFHLRIDANTFKSDGGYELVIEGKAGVDVHRPVNGPFIASKGEDIHIKFLDSDSGCDCEAFGDDKGEPDFYNVCEVKEIENNPSCFDLSIKNEEAVRWAELSITFNKPFLFNLPGYGQHCQGLFFDPYLKVKHDGEPDEDEISRTPNIDDLNPDPRILCVKNPEWQWPEEGRRIDRVYPDVNITCPERGKPPTFEFREGWDGNHNSCVFDGEVCEPEVDICKLK